MLLQKLLKVCNFLPFAKKTRLAIVSLVFLCSKFAWELKKHLHSLFYPAILRISYFIILGTSRFVILAKAAIYLPELGCGVMDSRPRAEIMKMPTLP
jgi:hypothetical protein